MKKKMNLDLRRYIYLCIIYYIISLNAFLRQNKSYLLINVHTCFHKFTIVINRHNIFITINNFLNKCFLSHFRCVFQIFSVFISILHIIVAVTQSFYFRLTNNNINVIIDLLN